MLNFAKNFEIIILFGFVNGYSRVVLVFGSSNRNGSKSDRGITIGCALCDDTWGPAGRGPHELEVVFFSIKSVVINSVIYQ